MPVFEREWLTAFPFKHHLSFRSDGTCKWSLNIEIFVAVIVETISNVTFDIYGGIWWLLLFLIISPPILKKKHIHSLLS